jgi:pimeloyl-ACP methyl ester carboxylesterase
MQANTPPSRFSVFRKWIQFMSISRLIRWTIYVSLSYWVYANWWKDLPMTDLKTWYSYPESQFIVVDGMEVHVRVCGKGEPILLLHDANSALQTWNGWTEQLSKKYQVIAVDLPGFGLTGPHPRSSYSAFMYADFLQHLVTAMGIPKFHLAGCGLGAQIAWFYAAESPEKIRSLILLDAPGFEGRSNDALTILARTPLLNRVIWTITPRMVVEIMLEDVYADDTQITDSLVQRHFNLLLRAGNRKAFTDRAQVSDNKPPVDIIEKITAPTLILWGAEDARISPEYAYEFHRRIHGALLKIYQNTGHWPQEENPSQTVEDVIAFLEGKF